jgi:hypothetical protein
MIAGQDSFFPQPERTNLHLISPNKVPDRLEKGKAKVAWALPTEKI